MTAREGLATPVRGLGGLPSGVVVVANAPEDGEVLEYHAAAREWRAEPKGELEAGAVKGEHCLTLPLVESVANLANGTNALAALTNAIIDSANRTESTFREFATGTNRINMRKWSDATATADRLFLPPASQDSWYIEALVDGAVTDVAVIDWGPTRAEATGTVRQTALMDFNPTSRVEVQYSDDHVSGFAEFRTWTVGGDGAPIPANAEIRIYRAVARGPHGRQGDPGPPGVSSFILPANAATGSWAYVATTQTVNGTAYGPGIYVKRAHEWEAVLPLPNDSISEGQLDNLVRGQLWTQGEIANLIANGVKPFAAASGPDIQTGDIGAQQVQTANLKDGAVTAAKLAEGAALTDDSVEPSYLKADTAAERAAMRRRIGAEQAGNDKFFLPIAETTLSIGAHGPSNLEDIGFQRTPAITHPFGSINGSANPYPFSWGGKDYLLYGVYGDDIGSQDSGTLVISIYRQTDGADELGGQLAFVIDGVEYVLADSPTVPNASGVSEWQFTGQPNPFPGTSGEVPLSIRAAWSAREIMGILRGSTESEADADTAGLWTVADVDERIAEQTTAPADWAKATDATGTAPLARLPVVRYADKAAWLAAGGARAGTVGWWPASG